MKDWSFMNELFTMWKTKRFMVLKMIKLKMAKSKLKKKQERSDDECSIDCIKLFKSMFFHEKHIYL